MSDIEKLIDAIPAIANTLEDDGRETQAVIVMRMAVCLAEAVKGLGFYAHGEHSEVAEHVLKRINNLAKGGGPK